MCTVIAFSQNLFVVSKPPRDWSSHWPILKVYSHAERRQIFQRKRRHALQLSSQYLPKKHIIEYCKSCHSKTLTWARSPVKSSVFSISIQSGLMRWIFSLSRSISTAKLVSVWSRKRLCLSHLSLMVVASIENNKAKVSNLCSNSSLFSLSLETSG